MISVKILEDTIEILVSDKSYIEKNITTIKKNLKDKENELNKCSLEIVELQNAIQKIKGEK